MTVLIVDDLIDGAFHLTSSFNDDMLRMQRQVHLGELEKELREQTESPGKRKRAVSVVSCSFGGCIQCLYHLYIVCL